MTAFEALKLFQGVDLVGLGMQAFAERERRHGSHIVTYCLDPEPASTLTMSNVENPLFTFSQSHKNAQAITPLCEPGATATEYLKFVAVCRLYFNAPHIQLCPEWSGLKVAQIALRFGADDFGNSKPSSTASEEEIRRIIRGAGFVPKKRNALYTLLEL